MMQSSQFFKVKLIYKELDFEEVDKEVKELNKGLDFSSCFWD